MTGPYCWECLLDLADSLLGAPPDGVHPEAVYRTVINRAYYAAFGALSTFYRDKGVELPVLSAIEAENRRRRGA